MMSVLTTLGITLLLAIEGWLIAACFLRAHSDRWLRCTLALPIASLANVFVFFDLTVLQLPLRALLVLAAHGLTIAVAATIFWRRRAIRHSDLPLPRAEWRRWHRSIAIVCTLLLAIVAAYAVAHSVLLPTFHYDSATNWVMRSKASFVAGKLLFDSAPPHDMLLKPHYPFLLHALHLAGNMGREQWSDAAAGVLPLLTSFSMLVTVALLVARLRGRLAGLVAITLLLAVPLFGFHLGEGYADHLLAEQSLLALLMLALARVERARLWLLLSALFASAAVWTKAEGIVFVFLPWFLCLLLAAWRHSVARRDARIAAGLGLILSAPWLLFLLASGLALTPHGGSDWHLALHPEGVRAALRVLFGGGSFGVVWYLLLLAALLLAWEAMTGSQRVDRSMLPILTFGLTSVILVLAVYLLTPNVEYLLNGQSFDRQLLTPVALLMLSFMLCLAPRKQNASPS